jgi:predicted DNA-binding transcriptional regulator YafY
MAHGQHDTIAYRLSQILIKLNQGDYLDPAELADEFGTHVRTIQRDLKVRLAHLPLLKTRGRYHLEAAYLGKLNFKDIERFAALAGVKGLFPSLSRDFLKESLGEQIQAPWLVRGHHYEDLSSHAGVFSQLEEVVLQHRLLTLDLLKDGQIKTYRAVQPYRLVNTKGIWYLAAVHGGRLKTFGVGKIRSVQVHAETYSRDATVEASIQSEEGIWHSPLSQKVLLSVAPEAAEYFKRRQLIPHQKVIREATDGTLTVETTVGHPNQILPIVRYWIPSVRILSPEDWNDHLVEQLSGYLNSLPLHRSVNFKTLQKEST